MNHGFDEFVGFISGNIDAQSHHDRTGKFDWWVGRENKKMIGHHSDLITEHSIDFIERNQKSPFFLYVAHGAPHTPIQARDSLIQRGPHKGEEPEWSKGTKYNDKPGDDNWLIKHFTLPVDEGVGEVLRKLKDPQEKNDIAASFPEKVSNMKEAWIQMLEETVADSPYRK